MSELTFGFITESADLLWPPSAIRTQNLARNAGAARNFIRAELAGLIAPASARITTSTPTILQMQARLAERTSRIASAPITVRHAEQRLAHAEQITVRVNELRISRTLPQMPAATVRIQTAVQSSDAARRRGDDEEANRLAQVAAAEASALERAVQEATAERIRTAGQAGDALAWAAGLFTGLMADANLANMVSASHTEQVGGITTSIREAQSAYIDENYSLVLHRARDIETQTAALVDAAENAIARQQQEANAAAAALTLNEMGFATQTMDREGTLVLTARDRGRAALDIAFDATGQFTIDSHTHGTFSGATCSVAVGKFLRAYREKVRIEDVQRNFVGTGGAPGSGQVRDAQPAGRRRLSAQEVLAQANDATGAGRGAPPQAVVAAWTRLRH